MNHFLAILTMPGWQELMIIGVIVLIVFGPRRLPEIAEAFGKSIRKFKSATKSTQDEVKKAIDSDENDKEE